MRAVARPPIVVGTRFERAVQMATAVFRVSERIAAGSPLDVEREHFERVMRDLLHGRESLQVDGAELLAVAMNVYVDVRARLQDAEATVSMDVAETLFASELREALQLSIRSAVPLRLS